MASNLNEIKSDDWNFETTIRIINNLWYWYITIIIIINIIIIIIVRFL